MKESEFIEQNKKKWLEFENSLEENIPDPATTTKLFVQITDDLSYARTFYPNRSVRLYLNDVAKLLFNDLSKSKKGNLHLFFEFWKTDLPLAMWSARRAMLISLLVFIASFTLGVLSSIHDSSFAEAILSSDYVHMTNENIKKGDPMAVYKSDSEIRTFLPILLNNLKVDLITFFSGLIMAIGSLVVMITNGIMVGVFQYFFIEKGLFWQSFLGIWTHGSLEIPTIILSGGAGLTLGKGLLFPGTYSRFQAFKMSGLQGLKIVLGVAPLTFIAAFVEGFLTRHTDIPDVIRFVFILLSFSTVIVYYYVYPKRVAKQHKTNIDVQDDSTLAYKEALLFDTSKTYTAPELITQGFRLFFKGFKDYALLFLGLPLLTAVVASLNPDGLFREVENLSSANRNFFDYDAFPARAIYTFVILSFGLYYIVQMASARVMNKPHTSFLPIQINLLVSSCISSALIVFLVYLEIDYTIAFVYMLLPVLIFITTLSGHKNISLFAATAQGLALIGQSFGRFIASTALFVIIALITNAAIVYALNIFMIKEAVIWALTDNNETVTIINFSILSFQYYFCMFLMLTLTGISSVFLVHTLQEISTADNLVERIKKIELTK